MSPKSPEEELDAFLASQPTWRQKWLQLDAGSWTNEELLGWSNSDFAEEGSIEARYKELLRRVPARWHEYRKRHRQLALASVPPGKPGRPRKDVIAAEARTMLDQGMNYAQIADALNKRFGSGATTKEAIRKLLKSREHESPPDKT